MYFKSSCTYINSVGISGSRALGRLSDRECGRTQDGGERGVLAVDTGQEVLIKELLKNGTSKRKIAKICKVDRNTLARFIELKGLAEK